MLACAILPFLPLIVDAHIRQLGDDDFAKREAATQFLGKVLRDTDGYRNYTAMLAVKKARESKDAETKARADSLYRANKSKYVGEHSYLAVVLRIDGMEYLRGPNPREMHGAEYEKAIAKVREIHVGFDCRGFGPQRTAIYLCLTSFENNRKGKNVPLVNYDASKLFALKNRPEVIEITALDDYRKARDFLIAISRGK
jgi:hypothetical protein